MKILVVDDDVLVRKSIDFRLSLEGHEVISAKDGLDAIEKLAKQVPEVVICDIIMPNVSGIAFIQVLRENINYNIPVIVISALDKGGIIAAGLGLKNIDFLPKPIDFNILLNKLNNYPKKHQYENSNPNAKK